jgi:hypothetical protein
MRACLCVCDQFGVKLACFTCPSVARCALSFSDDVGLARMAGEAGRQRHTTFCYLRAFGSSRLLWDDGSQGQRVFGMMLEAPPVS